ncbi:nucleotide exchange factor GrpE [Candidatus Endoriftia persephone]|uniref:Protein GrpE n=2 Tax=sulfur-oxidizing symbionts TaxID=32036 RepID=G2FCJ4_9GAMM|nr:nucleotide exchange factor GrpE [Candidatus Endoriftia persephone]EGW55557.1 protein GrpE [endosymbiont of Tevnia jerichonana (vent Tica)]
MAAPENEAEVVDAESVEVVAEKDLVRLLEDARSKADEHWDALVRARAEIENLRKRHERDLENAHKFALDRFTQDLLQVWDSLELGHQAAQDENVDVARLREGTELTLKLLNDVMSKNQVEQIDPEGEAFNPEFHQAMSMQERDDMEPNTVVAVVQKGYSLNGRLLRPAMVIVSRAPSAPVDEQA